MAAPNGNNAWQEMLMQQMTNLQNQIGALTNAITNMNVNNDNTETDSEPEEVQQPQH